MDNKNVVEVIYEDTAKNIKTALVGWEEGMYCDKVSYADNMDALVISFVDDQFVRVSDTEIIPYHMVKTIKAHNPPQFVPPKPTPPPNRVIKESEDGTEKRNGNGGNANGNNVNNGRGDFRGRRSFKPRGKNSWVARPSQPPVKPVENPVETSKPEVKQPEINEGVNENRDNVQRKPDGQNPQGN